MAQVETQFFSNLSDARGKWRLISFDDAAGNLPWVLVHRLYEEDTSQLIAEEAPGSNVLCRKRLIELRSGVRAIGERLLAHGPHCDQSGSVTLVNLGYPEQPRRDQVRASEPQNPSSEFLKSVQWCAKSPDVGRSLHRALAGCQADNAISSAETPDRIVRGSQPLGHPDRDVSLFCVTHRQCSAIVEATARSRRRPVRIGHRRFRRNCRRRSSCHQQGARPEVRPTLPVGSPPSPVSRSDDPDESPGYRPPSPAAKRRLTYRLPPIPRWQSVSRVQLLPTWTVAGVVAFRIRCSPLSPYASR